MIGFVLRKMAASVGRSLGGERERERERAREREGGGGGALGFQHLPHQTATADRRANLSAAEFKDPVCGCARCVPPQALTLCAPGAYMTHRERTWHTGNVHDTPFDCNTHTSARARAHSLNRTRMVRSRAWGRVNVNRLFNNTGERGGER